MINLAETVFDESDGNLFQVDDARLRADALRHSLLPRLQVLLHRSITLVRGVVA